MDGDMLCYGGSWSRSASLVPLAVRSGASEAAVGQAGRMTGWQVRLAG